MPGDKIFYNGRLVTWDDTAVSPAHILTGNFVYQKVHTYCYKPLNLGHHLRLLSESYRTLYKHEPILDQPTIRTRTEKLLFENRYPKASNIVTIYLCPSPEKFPEPDILIVCEKQCLYKGYALWHDQLAAVTAEYDFPFPFHKTAVSLNAHRYSADFARLHGAGTAINATPDGTFLSAGESPLFAVWESNVYTTPLEAGLPDSVERMLCINCCRDAGRKVFEMPLKKSEGKEFDEFFAFTPEGIISIGRLGGKSYSNSMARILEGHLRNYLGDKKLP